MSLKELRAKREMTQEALAYASGLSLRQIVKIENVRGVSRRISFETFDALAIAFGVDYNTLGPIVKGVA